MDGATSCSWVFVCESACVRLHIKTQRFGPFYDNNTTAFFTKETFFDMPKNAPNSSEKQHRKNFVVRNDEKVARRINVTPDVTTRPPCMLSRVLNFSFVSDGIRALLVHNVNHTE